MPQIGLNNLPFYAYHGLHPEERALGGRYLVSLTTQLHNPSAGTGDELSETLDYGTAYRVIAQEMAIPRNLLETLARRIAEGVLALDERLAWVQCRVEKQHPPLGSPSGSAWVEYRADRSV